jgi:hypothetical protein
MEHSIAARYASRPAARFPRPSSGTRRRRMGLAGSGAFRTPPLNPTVLRSSGVSPLVRLRRASRGISLARPIRRSSGRPRPIEAMTWPRSVPVRRRSAPVAPWRD